MIQVGIKMVGVGFDVSVVRCVSITYELCTVVTRDGWMRGYLQYNSQVQQP